MEHNSWVWSTILINTRPVPFTVDADISLATKVFPGLKVSGHANENYAQTSLYGDSSLAPCDWFGPTPSPAVCGDRPGVWGLQSRAGRKSTVKLVILLSFTGGFVVKTQCNRTERLWYHHIHRAQFMAKGKLPRVQSHTNIYVAPQKKFFLRVERDWVKNRRLWCKDRVPC